MKSFILTILIIMMVGGFALANQSPQFNQEKEMTPQLCKGFVYGPDEWEHGDHLNIIPAQDSLEHRGTSYDRKEPKKKKRASPSDLWGEQQ